MCMINVCKNIDDYWMSINSPDIVQGLTYRGYSEIRRHELYSLKGLKKTLCGKCGTPHRSYYDKKIRRIRDLSCGDARIYLELEIRRVKCRSCGKVKQEKIDWISNNPFYTKRFSFYVGRKCRAMTIRDVSRELKLDWHPVNTLEKEYMQEQLRRNPVSAPRIIGIYEISLKKGHTYRIIVSDLERNRPESV